MRGKRLLEKRPLPKVAKATTHVSSAQDQPPAKRTGAVPQTSLSPLAQFIVNENSKNRRTTEGKLLPPLSIRYRLLTMGNALAEQLRRHVSQVSGSADITVDAALIYLRDRGTSPAYKEERECLEYFLENDKIHPSDIFLLKLRERFRELLNNQNPLSNTGFRGSVDTGQAAPDRDLRETPAGTTGSQMSESRTIDRAKREVVRRTGKKAKTRGLAAAAAKTTQRRRSVALSKQPGYQVPIRRNNAPVTLLIERQTYSKMKRISETSGVSMNKIFGELAAAFVARYETNPITISPHDAIQMDHEAKLQAVRQLAYAIQIAVK